MAPSKVRVAAAPLPPRLNHREATIDPEDLAGDVAGLVGGEEGDGRGDLVDGGEAAPRRGGLDGSLTVAGSESVSSVTTKPGATALTVILRAILEALPIAPAVE